MNNDILTKIEQTPFADTHEHFFREKARLAGAAQIDTLALVHDFSIFFTWYGDFISAGMPAAEHDRFLKPGVDPGEKWRLIAPFYESVRNTGYFRAVHESVRLLYAEDGLDESTYARISDKVAAGVQPGFYQRILKDVAHIAHAQVGSVEDILPVEMEYPGLLYSEFNIDAMTTNVSRATIETLLERTGLGVSSLADWHGVIDWAFAKHAPAAVALKSTAAYSRRLDIAPTPAELAAPAFARCLSEPDNISPPERKLLEDHLFHYCMGKAQEYRLPVKLHTGYHTGAGYMRLHDVRKNPSDMCALLQRYPQINFIIMHISYPYQDETIALAKHYANAYIDLCWAWILNPSVCVRFLKDFLMAAPANKILTFGGDYGAVENVPGHARIARLGLAQALTELTEEGWLCEEELEPLIRRLMIGNAEALFDYTVRPAG